MLEHKECGVRSAAGARVALKLKSARGELEIWPRRMGRRRVAREASWGQGWAVQLAPGGAGGVKRLGKTEAAGKSPGARRASGTR